MGYSKEVQQEAIEKLREMLPPGSVVHTVVRHVSKSGMTRWIDCYLIEDNSPQWISRLVAKAADYTFTEKRESVKVEGCGMDMGFSLVYNLSHKLYPDGFGCIGEGCPSNDHSNGDRNYEPHHHNSGGYAIRQKWM